MARATRAGRLREQFLLFAAPAFAPGAERRIEANQLDPLTRNVLVPDWQIIAAIEHFHGQHNCMVTREQSQNASTGAVFQPITAGTPHQC